MRTKSARQEVMMRIRNVTHARQEFRVFCPEVTILFSHQNIRATKKRLLAGDWELNSTGYSLAHIKFRLINHLAPQNAAKQHMTK